MTRHAVVARLDRPGDVLVCGPAVRAVAAAVDRVTVLCSPAGAPAAALLPGVDDLVVWECPWISFPPPPVGSADVPDVVGRLAALGADEALVLTSFHQSALPTALVLRLAGIGRVAAVSTDYPGDLLAVRIPEPADAPEAERMLAVAARAGYAPHPADDRRLAVRAPGPSPVAGPYVVVHPGADAAARRYPQEHWNAVVAGLTARGSTVVVTGTRHERDLTRAVAAGAPLPGRAVDLGGRSTLAELAAVLAGADVLATGNTAPAHLAAAVGTPVVSLFAPVVPAVRWAPYGVPSVLLGDQDAPCRGTRARTCPVPGHPCLTGVDPAHVLEAIALLAAHDLEVAR